MSVEVRVNRTKLISGAVKTPVVPAQSTLLFHSYWNQKVLDTTSGTCSQGMTVRDSIYSHCCSHWDFNSDSLIWKKIPFRRFSAF